MNQEKPKVIKKNLASEVLSLDSQLSLKETSSKQGGVFEKSILKKQDLTKHEKQQDILDDAVREAEGIKERARTLLSQVEKKISDAKKKGFDQGREEGLSSVTEILMAIKKENQKLLEGLTREALELVYEISKKIVGEAFEASEEALAEMIRQGLQVSMGERITVFLNPKDYKKLKGQEAKLLTSLHGTQVLQLKPLETVKEKGCLIESELGSVEADLESQLKTIKKVLGL